MPRPTVPPKLLLCLAAIGCGSESYEARVTTNSVPFFRHQAQLNENLGPRAGRGEVTLRLPQGFQLIPPPRPPKPGSGPERDPRLPPGFDGDLPGLTDGFKGQMRAFGASGGGAAQPVPVFAYLLSSRVVPKPAAGATATTESFDKVVFRAVAGGLGLPTDPMPGRDMTVGGQDFAPTLRYTPSAFETNVDGVPMRYRLFVNSTLGLPVAVLFVVPRDADRSERLEEKIALSLETLQIRAASARPPGGGAAPAGGGPAGGSGAPSF